MSVIESNEMASQKGRELPNNVADEFSSQPAGHLADSAPPQRRVAVLTGATGGIGRWIALGLIEANFHLIVICRDRNRGKALAQWLAQRTSATRDSDLSMEWVIADLSSLSETRSVGERIASVHPSISLLVNNAGMFSAHRHLTAEGREAVLTVNHLSPYVLSDALEGALREGAPSRIVNVGSSTSDRGRIDPSRLERPERFSIHGWNMVRAYRESKLALMMTTFLRAKRLEGSGVVANVVHPGTVATSLIREGGVIGLAWRLMAPFCLNEEQGAQTPLFAALDPSWESKSGKYVKRCAVARPNSRALDASLCARVDAATRALIDAVFKSEEALPASASAFQ